MPASRQSLRLLAATLLLALSLPAAAQIISGPAQAIDGDSLEMTGTRIRLFGVDAPEAQQTCERGGAEWTCGQEAAAVLARLVQGKQLRCEAKDRDAYGRQVAVCTAGRVDLAQAMVAAGMAVALPDFTKDYVSDEAQAKAQQLGLWGSTFAKPAAYRAAHPRQEPRQAAVAQPARQTPTARQRPAVASQGACNIKGNHSPRGEWIYHLPGMPYYNATRAEAMFCTEAQARAAGYRRAIVR